MRTVCTVALFGAKVIKSPRQSEVVVTGNSSNGSPYAWFLVADIESGNVYKILCFDALAKKAKNMNLVALEDTIYVTGVLSMRTKKDEEGKILSQFISIKAGSLDYGPKLKKEQKENLSQEIQNLDASNIFKNGIPCGKPFK